MKRVIFVTDPMCSWCWGMTPAIEEVTGALADRFEFDFMLGGINTHGTQPIGDYGRRRLFRLWREVSETTGQSFGFRLPDPLLYNSVLPCMAVHAVRTVRRAPPFGYLHRLQYLFFEQGVNINDRSLLCSEAAEFGVDASAFHAALDADTTAARARAEFEGACKYGTAALPNVLMQTGATRKLVAGGFVDGPMLTDLLVSWPD